MLRCEDHSIYTGIAKDVQRRFAEHQQRKKEGAKYTKSHPVSRVEAVFAAASRSDASKLEYAIKQLKKEQKEWLIVHPEQWKEIMPERISGCAFVPVRVE
jgi:putative endonuclease